MKTKEARKIAKSAAAGTAYPAHVLRAAALRLGRPIVVDTHAGDFTYFPKGLKGKFVSATLYRKNGQHCFETSILPVGTDLSAYARPNGYVRDLEMVAGQHRLDVSAGCEVQGTCRCAVRLANRLRMVVRFNFNGVEVVARPGVSTGYSLYHAWNAELDRKRREYEASNEYKQLLAEQEAERVREQAIIDGLVSTLRDVVDDREKLLRWLGEFAAHADNNTLTYPMGAVNLMLKSAGYVANAWVGHKDEIEADPVKNAEYLVGQAISCMDSGMPPHPILTDFVKRYFGEAEEPAYDDEDVDVESEDTVEA